MRGDDGAWNPFSLVTAVTVAYARANHAGEVIGVKAAPVAGVEDTPA